MVEKLLTVVSGGRTASYGIFGLGRHRRDWEKEDETKGDEEDEEAAVQSEKAKNKCKK